MCSVVAAPTSSPAPLGWRTEWGWLGSGGSEIFASVTCSPSGATSAALLCPPLFSEYDVSYPAFRLLSHRLAEERVSCLCIDYRGTGDSGGANPQLTEIGFWIDDIRMALSALRQAGAHHVTGIGMRAGALLLSEAAQRGASFDALVLWDPCETGRRALRQHELLMKTSLGKYGEHLGTLSFAMRAMRESFCGLRLQAPSVPTLLLTRDGSLPASMHSASNITTGQASDQAAFLDADLSTSALPLPTIQHVSSWTASLAGGSSTSPLKLRLSRRLNGAAFTEHVVSVPASEGSSCFAVECRPVASEGDLSTCLLLNAGLVAHHGPSRWYVELSRHLAERGIGTVRIDLPGLGASAHSRQSPPPHAFAPQYIRDLRVIVASLRPRIAIGLCSGGYHALEAAAAWPGLDGVIAVNLTMDSGVLRYDPAAMSDDRRCWVPDRRWLACLRRRHLGAAALWRMPRLGWLMLSHVGGQPSTWSKVVRLAKSGTRVSIIDAESARFSSRERVGRAQARPVDFSACVADHSLVGAGGRARVTESVARILIGWGYGTDVTSAPPDPG